MKYIYTADDAAKIDKHAIETIGIPGLVLMEKAAMTVVRIIAERERDDVRILVVCGIGNNGGDGAAIARLLHIEGYAAALTVVGDTAHMSPDMKIQMEIVSAAHVPVVSERAIAEGDFDVIVDGLFGIGLKRDIEGVYKKVIDDINDSNATVYAIDIPSGIDATSGKVKNAAVRADTTVTFGMQKLGLILYPGAEYAGEVVVGKIGYPNESMSVARKGFYYYEPDDIQRFMPKRYPVSNKGTYGRVLVIAGSDRMSGAAYLAAKAAYSMGAGLVELISSDLNRDTILTALPEIIFGGYDFLDEAIERADAIVIGPGLGLDDEARGCMSTILSHSKVPTVIDGDGIRLYKDMKAKLCDNFILTPHVAEMAYFSDLTTDDIKDDISGIAKKTATDTDAIIVLKDARTVVSDGDECYINVSGNSGMATGGSGDVLAGMMGGLLSQGVKPFDAARLAVYIHGLSGDVMADIKSKYSLMASDLIIGISKVLEGL